MDQATWSEVGLTALPADTPAWVPLGGPHPALHLVEFDGAESAVGLDARWALRTVTVVEPTAIAAGDVVVLMAHELWWPPSRVVRSEPGVAERTVTVLVDRHLPVLHVDGARDGVFDGPLDGPLDDSGKRTVRDLWGLDVWCPSCGAVGAPILWGMPMMDALEARDADGNLRPWPAGEWSLGGCLVGGAVPSYDCRRCGRQWGEASGDVEAEQVAFDVTALLELAEAADLRELAEMFASDEADVVLTRTVDGDLHLEVDGTRDVLTFPLWLSALEDAIEELR